MPDLSRRLKQLEEELLALGEETMLLEELDGSTAGLLPGWRRSADRTRLRKNSLLTGNFTGNFAISTTPGPIL